MEIIIIITEINKIAKLSSHKVLYKRQNRVNGQSRLSIEVATRKV